MISKVIGLYMVGFALAATTSYASVNLVTDGDFAQPLGGSTYLTVNASDLNPTIGAWTVTQGSVDLIGGYWTPPTPGEQSVDMAGFYQNGTIQQTIPTLGNSIYLLTFDLAGNPDGAPTEKQLQVNFGGQLQTFTFDITGKSHSNMGWTTQNWILKNLPVDALLSFTDVSETGTAFGAAIANVSVTAVPEPSTIIAGALLLLPFGVSTLRSLRRNRE